METNVTQQKLSVRKGLIKSKLTRLQTYFNNVLATYSADEILLERDKIELSKRLDDATNLLSDFQEIILELPTFDESVQSELEDFETHFYRLTAEISERLKISQVPNTRSSSSEASSQGDAKSKLSSTSKHNVAVKLPEISLPKFSGNQSQWISYRNLFNSLIEQNEGLDAASKMHYLLSSLEGQALEVVKGLAISQDNYKIARDALFERYNSDRSLVFFHVRELFNLNSLSKESAQGLRSLVDTVKRNLRSIESLLDVDQQREAILIYLVQQSLDPKTVKDFESQFPADKFPVLGDLIAFVEKRASLLNSIECRQDSPRNKFQGSRVSRTLTAQTSFCCTMCNGRHTIYNCDNFGKLDAKSKLDKAKQMQLCLNCLTKGHYTRRCKSKFNCSKCKARHHTLLCESINTNQPSSVSSVNENSNQGVSSPTTPVSISAFASDSHTILLPTVSVRVVDNTGVTHSVRALLDSGSMSSFISQELCNKLQLTRTPTNIQVRGITNSPESITHSCEVVMHAASTNFTLKANCLVISKIASALPPHPVSLDNWDIPSNVILADPNFGVPANIHILIGANYFWNVLLSGHHSLGKTMPTLHNTRFGYVVSGPIPFTHSSSVHSFHCVSSSVDDSLLKFWEVEEIPTKKLLSQEEIDCEQHFKDNTIRDESGRFVVRIPFRSDPSTLGDSQEQAKRRFFNLEKKLATNPTFSERYVQFMQEYENSGHMTAVSNSSERNGFFLPHHGVEKECSLTTKLRTVFDGSARSSNGISLNSLQMVGPVVQSDLFSILIRFRTHRYCISADIQAMYRQVLVAPADRKYQQILWRSNRDQELKTYELNTVTYGTASASFLATRCLVELGNLCEETNPLISRIIKQDFYVDDCLTGANTIAEAKYICAGLNKVLNSGCFPLRKWLSNSLEIVESVDEAIHHPDLRKFDTSSKTLGLLWSASCDQLKFSVSLSTSCAITKRTILSEISQIFDILGLVSPCIIRAKMLLQSIWLEKISWDSPLPPNLVDDWKAIRVALPELGNIEFSRHVLCNNTKAVSLHAFSDASTKAYGACIYLRSVDQDDNVTCSLLCSKGRVAPLKTLSIPRLELLGALILVRLASQVIEALNLKFDGITYWTDSTIVLSWIKLPPNRLCTFVANRIAEIQQSSRNATWHHIRSKDNPADLISRGLLPSELVVSDIWKHGPHFLQLPESSWPNSMFNVTEIPELKSEHSLVATSEILAFPFGRFSSLPRLARVMTYCLRFAQNCKVSFDKRQHGQLTSSEIDNAITKLIMISQNETFSSEIRSLKTNSQIRSSKIQSLSPFISDKNLVCVGGRIKNSPYDFEKKHPVLLDGKHHFSKLVALEEHSKLLHAGPQQMLFSIREKYWITSGRNLCKSVVRNCIQCFRNSPRYANPIMGDLPADRVSPSPPFAHTGVDFAGPFLLKSHKGRGSKTSKAYLCLFICFSSKAIHLELTTSLSTESFLMSLKRFVARRGKPFTMYSDNGKNFVGTNTEIKEIVKFLTNSKDATTKFATKLGFTWKFIPSYSPHFGGLWESSVKSCKFHIKRVAGNTPLTFEEFDTLLAQVESILNSRPLSPLSSDPSDLSPLTPGHFIIGRSLTTVPEADLTSEPTNRLNRYQHLQQMNQHFWKRWSQEYLGELQRRTKWQRHRSDLKLNSLVLLRNDNLPPLKWRLGRVTATFPGKDGIVRVAEVKTSTGIFRRSFANLCPLPINSV